MAYDFQEQEEIESLKAFWARWGTLILAVITAGLLAWAGAQGWKWYQARSALQADQVLSQLDQALTAKDADRIRDLEAELRDDHAGTVQADLGALRSARALHDAGNVDAAARTLKWVVDKGVTPEYRLIARLRLAGLELDREQYDAALALLAGGDPAASGTEMKAAFDDRRGDVLFAQKKPDEARKAWDAALAALSPASPLRGMVELKRNALGGE